MIRALGLAARAALWTLMVLWALHNAGVDITALVAGLGIGGVAVALALQNILTDVFSSVAILFDKPYQVGDFIAVGDSMGTVESIGIKTTRMRSQSGEQLVFANGELLKSRIRNFKRMHERRMAFNINLTYQTPPEKVASAASLLREIVETQQPIRFDRAHFKAFGTSALEFEVVYFVLSPDNNLAMDIQQRINLQILERFAAAGIEFAYPTQTLPLRGTQPDTLR
jgi:small-conductance mechanosensitive channel